MSLALKLDRARQDLEHGKESAWLKNVVHDPRKAWLVGNTVEGIRNKHIVDRAREMPASPIEASRVRHACRRCGGCVAAWCARATVRKASDYRVHGFGRFGLAYVD
jgi:hypothetical protein